MLSALIFFALEAILCGQAKYHNPEEINSILSTLNNSYPEITMLETIGKTDSGKEINTCTMEKNSRTKWDWRYMTSIPGSMML